MNTIWQLQNSIFYIILNFNKRRAKQNKVR